MVNCKLLAKNRRSWSKFTWATGWVAKSIDHISFKTLEASPVIFYAFLPNLRRYGARSAKGQPAHRRFRGSDDLVAPTSWNWTISLAKLHEKPHPRTATITRWTPPRISGYVLPALETFWRSYR